MKILLVYPRWEYPTFGELQEPLGLLAVGSMLKSRGHEVRLLDLAVSAIEEFDALLPRTDLVGISSSTVLYGRACRVLDRVREARPELPVIIGGPHATVLAEETIERGFTAAVIGEGEHAAFDLVQALEQGRPLHQVPGVVARDGDTIVRGPVRGFEPDLDHLPDPDRSLVDYQKYFEARLTHVGLMASRGCPWNCLFCKPMQDKLFGRKVRFRSVGRIAAEMAAIVERLDQRRFLFKDDTIVLGGVEWFAELERELGERGLLGAVSFSCQARVDQVNRPLLEQMKKCGLEGVAFGVESGSQKVLDFYRKQIKVAQTITAFELCHELGIGTHAFIMLGAPVETKDDLAATIELVRKIKTQSLSVSITTPAPGTDLYEYTRQAGIFNVRSHEESDYHYNRRPINLPHLSVQDLARAEEAIIELAPGTYFKDQLESRMKGLLAPESDAA